MRKLFLLLSSTIALVSAPLAAQNATSQRTDLPITAVSLFSSGVGYFEHNGTVRGNATAELRVKTTQINDILKSLVLIDLDGGRIGGVTYPSQDPLEKTLRSFQVDIAGNPGLGDLLNQLRGSRVTITSQAERVAGTILGVETQMRLSDRGETLPYPILNVLAGGVIRSVPLASLSTLALEDREVQDELTRALAAVTQARDQDRKPVVIDFTGTGNRRVRVGYVVETPVWKTSYRLLLDDRGSRLQGWAIVENQTDNDWNDISLSLVSGRPISFMMDLYQPLYATRPTVVPELFSGLRAPTYEAGIATGRGTPMPTAPSGQAAGRGSRAGTLRGTVRDAETNRPLEGVTVVVQNTTYGDVTRQDGTYFITDLPASTPLSIQARRVGYQTVQRDGIRLDQMNGVVDFTMRASQTMQSVTIAAEETPLMERAMSSVQAVADAARMGELFEYSIRNVTLPRQKSAMLPIVTDSVSVERVSIYNASVQRSHPLNGVRLSNITGKFLLQGPVTVLENGDYAGDARLDDVPPGQERMLSFGVDLDVKVDNTKARQDNAVVSGKIDRGFLLVEHKMVSTREYLIDNKSERGKTIIIEHPIRQGWKLVDSQEPFETTSNLYRFKGTASAGKVTTLTVTEEAVTTERAALVTSDVNLLLNYTRTGEIPKNVRDALTKAVQYRQVMVDADREAAARSQRIREVTEEQTRIRENMKTVEQKSDYYKRLLAKLDEQESQIEELQKERDDFQSRSAAARRDLESYLSTLSLGSQ